jgi:dUTP pyrophosphatase
MKIKIIEHGCPVDKLPKRAHANDVGADVYALKDYIIEVGCSRAIPLGFGLDLPAGFGAFIFPRSSQSKRGIDSKLPPLDPGYTGEMHAIIHNGGHEAYHIYAGDRIGQLVVLPVMLPDFVYDLGDARGDGAFGSTGK